MGVRAAVPPHVVWEHTLLDERLPDYPMLRRSLPLILRRYAQADLVVCPRARAGVCCGSVPHGEHRPDPDVVGEAELLRRACTGAREGRLRLLSSQRLVPVKNVALLAIEGTITVAIFGAPYAAGDGPERRALGRLAVARGLADRVEFVGHVSDIDVRLRDVDVLMHTARSETFGMALMEAAVSHVPVVCPRRRRVARNGAAVCPSARSWPHRHRAWFRCRRARGGSYR